MDDERIPTGEAPVQRLPRRKPIEPLPTPDVADGAAARKRRFMIFGALLAVAALGGGAYWWSVRNLESTDDAFIDGNAVALMPRIEGTVLRVAIGDNQTVRAGDVLVEIDPRDYEARLADARAAEAKSRADLEMVKATSDATLRQAQSNLAL